jgi:hypothetical protein
MPPVTRVMVSRPLESPRKSAYEPFHKHVYDMYSNSPSIQCSKVYGPEIGDMDEGIVEGCEDSGNAENKLSCSLVSIVQC